MKIAMELVKSSEYSESDDIKKVSVLGQILDFLQKYVYAPRYKQCSNFNRSIASYTSLMSLNEHFPRDLSRFRRQSFDMAWENFLRT